MDATNSKEEKLATWPLGKLMLTMGIPTLVAQLINILYNIVDRSFIGHIEGIGANALTGVGLAMPVIIIITAFSSFVSGGGAPLASIALGKGDRERAERILGNGFLALLIMSVLLMIVFYAIKEPFLYLIGGSDATYPYANDYISIYLMGTVFVQLTVGLNTFITAQGKSATAMISVLIGAVLNMILDPIFIFVFNMGVKGAAYATIISQACSAAWVLHFLFSKKATLRLKLSYMMPKGGIILSVAALGVSPFIMQSTEALISIFMNSGLQTYGGDLYVGSLTIIQSVMQFVTIPINGFGQGVSPIMSYNYGAGNVQRVKQTFKRLLLIMFTVSTSLTILTMTCPQIFARMFTNDQQLIDLVCRVLPIFMAGMTVFGIQMACQITFMALGQAKISLCIALLRKVVLLIPLALLLPWLTQDVMPIYYAEPISDFIAATCCGILFLVNIKKILSKAGKTN